LIAVELEPTPGRRGAPDGLRQSASEGRGSGGRGASGAPEL